jgi:hypothetical protein
LPPSSDVMASYSPASVEALLAESSMLLPLLGGSGRRALHDGLDQSAWLATKLSERWFRAGKTFRKASWQELLVVCCVLREPAYSLAL